MNNIQHTSFFDALFFNQIANNHLNIPPKNFQDKFLAFITTTLTKYSESYKKRYELINSSINSLKSQGNFSDEAWTTTLKSQDFTFDFLQKSLRIIAHFQNLPKVQPQKTDSPPQKNERAKIPEENVPAYLTELKTQGFTHLYEHLRAMKALKIRNDRTEEEKDISFSECSHIILQTKQAIIEKVKKTVSENPNMYFILGATGVGKSTTLAFLRGDKMTLKNDFYHSANDPELIGHGSSSCTFLPNIEMINGMTIIDFSGFEDTHGVLIAAGMELALGALVDMFSSRLLVLDSLNIEGRMIRQHNLNQRLHRLFANPQNAALGLTQYSNNHLIFAIYQQKVKQREKFVEDETKDLNKKINKYNAALRLTDEKTIKLPKKYNCREELVNKIFEFKKQLVERKRNAEQSYLPDNEQIEKLKKQLLETEQLIATTVGCELKFKFENLCDETLRQEALKTLSEIDKTVQAFPHHQVDVSCTTLLKTVFTNDLFPLIQKNYRFATTFKNSEEFKKSVQEEGLVCALVKKDMPEIVELSKLLDPKVFKEFDKEVFENCYRTFESQIQSLNLTTLTSRLPNDIKEKSYQLKKRLLGLKGGLSIPATEKSVEKNWIDYRKSWKEFEENRFQLPPWFSIIHSQPLNIPPTIYRLLNGKVDYENLSESEKKRCIQDYEYVVDRIEEMLTHLLAMKNIIHK